MTNNPRIIRVQDQDGTTVKCFHPNRFIEAAEGVSAGDDKFTRIVLDGRTIDVTNTVEEVARTIDFALTGGIDGTHVMPLTARPKPNLDETIK